MNKIQCILYAAVVSKFDAYFSDIYGILGKKPELLTVF